MNAAASLHEVVGPKNMKTDAEKIEIMKGYVTGLADWMRRRAERDSPAKADTPEQAYKQCAYRLDQFVVAINNGELWPNNEVSDRQHERKNVC